MCERRRNRNYDTNLKLDDTFGGYIVKINVKIDVLTTDASVLYVRHRTQHSYTSKSNCGNLIILKRLM